jgi:hypothetical protein
MQCVHAVAGVLLVSLSMWGCAFRSTATDWHGLKGLDGQPTYYTTTTKVGVNLFVALPFLGDMGITGLTQALTADIKEEGGNDVRIVQGTTESYFYGWPPLTLIITPVVSTVSAEYTPDHERYAKDQAKNEQRRGEGWSRKWYKPWTW